MKKIYSGALTLLIMGVVFVPSVHAETNTTTTTSTASIDAMLAQIKVLMAKVAELQKQLGTIKGEVRAVLKDGLAEGMSSDDIRKVQELLATDSAIYPEGKVTGYYGKLTAEALKRFQTRHELEITGTMNEETKALLEEYLHEGFGDRIPPGLLHAPGIMKKVELRFRDGCDNSGHGKNILCKKLKIKYEDEDEDDDSNDDDEDEDEDDDSNDDEFDVEVEVEDGTTTVSFTFESKDYTVKATSTDLDDVLKAVADKLDVDVDDLDEDLADEIENELDDANDKADADEAKKDADDAIDDAEDAIDDAEDAIDGASGDTSDAEALLDDAKEKLADAKTAFTAKKYTEAEDLADDAEDLAKDAEDAL